MPTPPVGWEHHDRTRGKCRSGTGHCALRERNAGLCEVHDGPASRAPTEPTSAVRCRGANRLGGSGHRWNRSVRIGAHHRASELRARVLHHPGPERSRRYVVQHSIPLVGSACWPMRGLIMCTSYAWTARADDVDVHVRMYAPALAWQKIQPPALRRRRWADTCRPPTAASKQRCPGRSSRVSRWGARAFCTLKRIGPAERRRPCALAEALSGSVAVRWSSLTERQPHASAFKRIHEHLETISPEALRPPGRRLVHRACDPG